MKSKSIKLLKNNMDLSCYGYLGPYKGCNGKIAVIGGCFEYTGAPYYAAAASLRAGGDLAHIFCTKSAAVPIKSYSPEIIVHPTLASGVEEDTSKYNNNIEEKLEETTKWYPAIHALIIGPGLGRDPFLTNTLAPKLISAAVDQSN
jgi:ATP-dependent NAD(P)H-hydrate dehydratase